MSLPVREVMQHTHALPAQTPTRTDTHIEILIGYVQQAYVPLQDLHDKLGYYTEHFKINKTYLVKQRNILPIF